MAPSPVAPASAQPNGTSAGAVPFSTFSHASSLPLHSKPQASAIDPKHETMEVSKPKDVSELTTLEAAKRLAAYAAVDNHIKQDHRVIGIG